MLPSVASCPRLAAGRPPRRLFRPGARFATGRQLAAWLVLLGSLLAPQLAAAGAPVTDPVINEFVANHTGADTAAFLEVLGDPSTDYTGFTLLEIEGDSSGSGPGAIEAVLPLGVTDPGGYWIDPEDMENGTTTVLLVEGFTGSAFSDVDTDNDGVFDSQPWFRIVDSVAVSDGGAGDQTYSSTVLAPGFGGSPFTPGGASRIPNGMDTDSAADWTLNDFDGFGLPGFPGSLDFGEAENTPGAVNRLISVAVDPMGGCGDPATPIHAIQGTGLVSLDVGSIREIEGIVTGDFESPTTGLGGFFLQEESADADGDPTTSEGLFVFNDGVGSVDPGDTVRVRGAVAESNGLTQLTNVVSVTVCPATGVTSPLAWSLPVLSVTDWESVEGMEVFIDQTLFVSGNFTHARFGEVELSVGGPLDDPTNVVAPGAPALALQDLNDRSRIQLDDGSNVQNPLPLPPYLGPDHTLRTGDTLPDLTGVVSQGFGVYEIHPTVPRPDIVVYTYTGRPFTFAQAPFTTSDFVSVTFALTQPLAPSSVIDLLTSPDLVPGSFSMSAGPFSLTLQDSINNVRFAFLQTDAAGQIVGWGFEHRTGLASDFPNNDVIGICSAPPLGGNGCVVGGLTRDWVELSPLNDGLESASVTNAPGIWTAGPAMLDFTRANPRPGVPNVGGRFQVAAYNVQNYFTTLDTFAPICGPLGTLVCRGADTAAELARQRDKLIAAIRKLDAEVIALVEIENHPADVPIADLVSGLDAATAPGTYAFIATGPIGTDAVRQALLYQPAAVTPLGSFQVLDASADPRFDDGLNRPTLVQSFTENGTGAVFTVAVNHLKSKGTPCDPATDPDLGDGQGNCNLTRTLAAQALTDFLAADPTGSGDGDVLILGDLNAFSQEDPIVALQTAGYTHLIDAFVGSGLAAGAYSFNGFGQSGALDHALSSPTLTPQVTGAAFWHVNADEPRGLDYNDFNQAPLYQPDEFRSSDHDPILIGLDLAAPDADGDGVSDASDNCIEVANASQQDTDNDLFGNACDCDFDQDLFCSIADFNVFLPAFQSTVDPGNGTDMDGSGAVGIGDFNAFLPGYQAGVPGPSGLRP